MRRRGVWHWLVGALAVAGLLLGAARWLAFERIAGEPGGRVGPGPGAAPGRAPAWTRPVEPYRPPVLRRSPPESYVVDPVLKVELVRDEVLVAMKPGTEPFLPAILAGLSQEMFSDPKALAISGRFFHMPVFEVLLAPKAVPALHAVVVRLSNHHFVAGACWNLVRQALRSFDDPALTNDVPIDDWGLRRIKAPEAWDMGLGRGVRVAVIDNGTRTDHEDLVGAIVDPWSLDSRSPQMVFTVDADGVWQGDHGSHVAGTIGARAGNRLGTAGVAPECSLMPIQAIIPKAPGGPAGANEKNVLAAVEWAATHGAQVANLSLGLKLSKEGSRAYHEGPPELKAQLEAELRALIARSRPVYQQTYDLADRHRLILCAAAGNDSIDADLLEMPNSRRTLAVGAYDPNERRSDFSNWGAVVDVCAPGTHIWSLRSDPNPGYKFLNGTSMATPHVAGLVALMKEILPDLTVEEAREILVRTGERVATDLPIGPLIQAPAALAATRELAAARPPPPPPPPPPEPPITDPFIPPVPPPRPTPGDGTPAPPAPPDWGAILDGGDVCAYPEIKRLIETWLSIATPPIPHEPKPWFYDLWGRALNNRTVFAVRPPDGGGDACRYVWQFARKLGSVRHGTLYEWVKAQLAGGSYSPAPEPFVPPPTPTPTPTSPAAPTRAATPVATPPPTLQDATLVPTMAPPAPDREAPLLPALPTVPAPPPPPPLPPVPAPPPVPTLAPPPVPTPPPALPSPSPAPPVPSPGPGVGSGRWLLLQGTDGLYRQLEGGPRERVDDETFEAQMQGPRHGWLRQRTGSDEKLFRVGADGGPAAFLELPGRSVAGLQVLRTVSVADDFQRMAAIGKKDGADGAWLIRAGGPGGRATVGLLQRLDGTRAQGSQLAISPDGGTVVLAIMAAGNGLQGWSLKLLPTGGGAAREAEVPAGTVSMRPLCWSSDSRYVALATQAMPPAPGLVVVVDREGRTITRHAATGSMGMVHAAAFAPDSGSLALAEAEAMNVIGTTRTVVLGIPGGSIRPVGIAGHMPFAWSRDGRRLVLLKMLPGGASFIPPIGEVALYDVGSGTEVAALRAGMLLPGSLHPEGDLLPVAKVEGGSLASATLHVLDLGTGTVRAWPGPAAAPVGWVR